MEWQNIHIALYFRIRRFESDLKMFIVRWRIFNQFLFFSDDGWKWKARNTLKVIEISWKLRDLKWLLSENLFIHLFISDLAELKMLLCEERMWGKGRDCDSYKDLSCDRGLRGVQLFSSKYLVWSGSQPFALRMGPLWEVLLSDCLPQKTVLIWGVESFFFPLV